MQLMNLQPEGQCDGRKAIGELTTHRSGKLRLCNWTNWQFKCQRICSDVIEELTTQRSSKLQHGTSNTYSPNVNELVATQLKISQSRYQGNSMKAIEELTTQRSMDLKQCDWITYSPIVNITATMQLKTSQPKVQENCNKAIGELTPQSSRKLTYQV